MNNQLFGIFVIAISVLGYYKSWKYQELNNFSIAVSLLIITGLILRIFTSSDFFLHEWDERYHALVAKNLINHPLVPTLYENPVIQYDYTNWVGNHFWLHKQPLPLWTMAASLWVFGVNEIALRIPSIILTTIGIWLTYFIGSYFFDKKIGYLSAFLYSINGLIIEITGGRTATDHIDVFFFFFIELAVFFSIQFVLKKNWIYNIFVGLSLGAAILSKWLPALIVIPIWFLIVLDSKTFNLKSIIFQLFLLVVISTIVFLPWQLYAYHTFPLEMKCESDFNYKHITETLEKQGGTVFYFLNKIRINYGELIYLPLIWFLIRVIKNPTDFKRLSLCVWFLIPFLFFSIIKTKMQAYILFTSPVLFMITAEFYYHLKYIRNNFKYKWLINLLLILFIALPIRYSIERIKPFSNIEREPKWVNELKELNKINYSSGVLFNYKNYVEAMFYTNLTVYPNTPTREVLVNLLKNGHTIIINIDGNIDENIKNIDGVLYKKIPSEE
jgi:4-amino-4-deoxy-L-arabinose transferase